MLTFADEMKSLTVAVSRQAIDSFLEHQKARRTSRSFRLFEDNQAQILDYMTDRGPLAINDVAEAVGLKRSTVYQHLQRLVDDGRVVCTTINKSRHVFEVKDRI